MEVMSPVDVFRTPRKHEGGITIGTADRSYRAFEALYATYVAMPVVIGLAMAMGVLVNWENFLAPALGLGHAAAKVAIRLSGLLEIALGGFVAVNPKIGAQTAAAWLWVGALNFLMTPGHKGLLIAVLTLSVGASALSQLAEEFEARAFKP